MSVIYGSSNYKGRGARGPLSSRIATKLSVICPIWILSDLAACIGLTKKAMEEEIVLLLLCLPVDVSASYS
jgi:hypothetical protein